jgi:putative membrane protein insertion efficiency factor
VILGLRRFLLALVVAPVRVYQRLISPALPARCKYEPSCSSYAISALRSYGIVRGSILAMWRLLRCNPWSHGGYDPVERQTLFRGPAIASEPSAGCRQEHHEQQEHTGAVA